MTESISTDNLTGKDADKTAKSAQIFIFVTIFIYLLGFGIMIPLLPAIAKAAGGSSIVSGALLSVFSAMQFLFSPFWGRLSDQYGRRPILLICLLGEAFAYFLMTLSSSIEMLFVSRIIAGFFGASISTASAYISDVTSEKNRSKGMALIGVAFGLGFLLGPAVGGLLSHLGTQMYGSELASIKLIAAVVTVVCILGFLFGWFFLKESFKKTSSSNVQRDNRLKVFLQVYRKPVVGNLIFVSFLSATAMACLESTLVLYVKDEFNWTLSQMGFGMVYVGVISLISQGFLVRKMLPKIGEAKVLLLGLILMVVAFTGISFGPNVFWLAILMTSFSLGISFISPALLGSISLLTDPKDQGLVLGTAQGNSSLGRIVGPLIGGFFYSGTHTFAFVVAAMIDLIAIFIVFSKRKHLPFGSK